MKKKIKILLIEDDKIEILKFQRAIIPIKEDLVITQAINGKEALSLLENELPNIILLDLNMPDTNGIEFLSILKSDEKLKYIPTIVLTTSDNEKDILKCYELGIAGYVLKPLKYPDYKAKILAIIEYWRFNEFKN